MNTATQLGTKGTKYVELNACKMNTNFEQWYAVQSLDLLMNILHFNEELLA